jgi:hypothetical protein
LHLRLRRAEQIVAAGLALLLELSDQLDLGALHRDAQPDDGPPRVGLWVLLENALASCGDRGHPTHVGEARLLLATWAASSVCMAASKSFGAVLMQNALKAEWYTAAAALECVSNASEAFSAPSKSADLLVAVIGSNGAMVRRGNWV